MTGPTSNHGREQMLGNIRRALRRGPLNAEQAAVCEARLAGHKENLIPDRARGLPPRGQVELFIKLAESTGAVVTRVKSAAEVPGAVADYLSGLNLPPQLVVSPDPALDAVPWADRPLLAVKRGAVDDGDETAVTACFAGVAETGTLMLLSGKDAPTRNNFLPDTHIVVIHDGQIVAAYEDGWSRLRDDRAGDQPMMPRTVNFITGPSRTADIEQKIELGMHGPRRLHIVLVEDSTQHGAR